MTNKHVSPFLPKTRGKFGVFFYTFWPKPWNTMNFRCLLRREFFSQLQRPLISLCSLKTIDHMITSYWLQERQVCLPKTCNVQFQLWAETLLIFQTATHNDWFKFIRQFMKKTYIHVVSPNFLFWSSTIILSQFSINSFSKIAIWRCGMLLCT